jgi:pimeloyl-ACP methyl ester carboxylesterase
MILAAFSVRAAQGQIPAAIDRDPPLDAKYPASGTGMHFLSHGVQVNAQLYRPAGAGVHPTVILLHGLPGNEQNLDLARVIQRAGWTVISFHYRGSWGSPGAFSFGASLEDADALVTLLMNPTNAKAWGVDSAHIVVIGHSFGGYVAARTAVAHRSVLGVALLAPWDISYDARAWSTLSKSRLAIVGPESFDDVEGRLAGATPASLTRDLMRDGPALNLTALAVPLTSRRLLIVTATRDDPDDKAIGLLAELRRRHGSMFTTKVLTTDHGFNDQRIALEVVVLNWLTQLPGTPPSP